MGSLAEQKYNQQSSSSSKAAWSLFSSGSDDINVFVMTIMHLFQLSGDIKLLYEQ